MRLDWGLGPGALDCSGALSRPGTKARAGAPFDPLAKLLGGGPRLRRARRRCGLLQAASALLGGDPDGERALRDLAIAREAEAAGIAVADAAAAAGGP